LFASGILALIAAVVLAAGGSSRMGRPKQTLLLRGVPMLQVVLEVLRRTRVGRVVVVLGANEEEARHSIRLSDEVVVVNRSHRSGMSSSIRAGLRALGPDVEAAIIVLGDQPFISPATVDRLIKAYTASKSRVVVPVFEGRRGNPVLFDRALFPEIMKVRGDVGARAVVRANEGSLTEVRVGDRGTTVDMDTQADYERAVSKGRRPKT
jgi:molybdenum cofactor cytidylyltransferase